MDVLKSKCKKCLVRDMDEAIYFENMFNYIENLDQSLKVSSMLYEERLGICKSCERLISGMCNACGCFVEMRAVIKHNNCPYDKW
nr:DUF6171 family protein [uncultured Niameybacter sp.]